MNTVDTLSVSIISDVYTAGTACTRASVELMLPVLAAIWALRTARSPSTRSFLAASTAALSALGSANGVGWENLCHNVVQ